MASKVATLRLTLRACSKISVGSMLKTWHRTAGLFAAAFLLLLTITGLLLMQADDLNLDGRYISDDRLLDWYGIRPAPPPLTFAVNDHLITQLGSRLYFNSDFLLNIDSQLIGTAPAADEILVVTTDDLLLLTADGNVAEQLNETAGVPPSITHVGISSDGTIVLNSVDGQFTFSPLDVRFTSTDTQTPVRWQSPIAAPAELIASLNRSYRGAGLTLERIIIDLHTGRLLGTFGVTLINLASVLLIVLIISGIWLWLGRARGNGSNDA